MKYGFNLLLWTGHVTDEHAPVLKALKRTGYDSVEVPVFEGTIDSYARLGEQLAKMDLDVTTASVLAAGHDPLSDDKMERQAAVERAKWVIDCTKALGGSIIAGPMHSELGRFTGKGPTADERKRGIEFHRRVSGTCGHGTGAKVPPSFAITLREQNSHATMAFTAVTRDSRSTREQRTWPTAARMTTNPQGDSKVVTTKNCLPPIGIR